MAVGWCCGVRALFRLANNRLPQRCTSAHHLLLPTFVLHRLSPQVSNAVQEDPVIKNPDGSITEVTTKAPGPANATRGNETVNFTSNATSNASALEAAPVSLDAATANVSRR